MVRVMLYPCMFCVLHVCRNMFGRVCYFVVECDGVIVCG